MLRRDDKRLQRFGAAVLYSILSLLQAGVALGQIVPIEESDFSDRTVRLPVGRLEPGSPAGEALNVYGVSFSGDASVPIAETVLIHLVVPPEADSVIRNEPLEGTSAEKALTMQFRYPLQRLGFTLSNGTFATEATVRALTRKGEHLGTLEIDEVRELRGPFVGFETTHPDGISTVVLDYGQEANGEQMTRIRFEYLDPPTHRLWFPQVAAGRAGSQQLSTLLQLQTLLPTGFGDVSAVVRFFDTDGNPMPVRIAGEANDIFELTIPFLAFRPIAIESPDQGTILGYASVEADAPITGQVIYSVSVTEGADPGTSGTGNGPLRGEAGVSADEERTIHVFPVHRERLTDRNTGIAIVNTSNEQSFVRMEIFEPSGLRPDRIVNPPGFFMAPREHRAFFLSELCRQSPPQSLVCETDFLASEDFQGTIEVSSQHPVALATLRTVNGLPVSSLPTGSTQR